MIDTRCPSFVLRQRLVLATLRGLPAGGTASDVHVEIMEAGWTCCEDTVRSHLVGLHHLGLVHRHQDGHRNCGEWWVARQ